jgi:hypothetical protein
MRFIIYFANMKFNLINNSEELKFYKFKRHA